MTEQTFKAADNVNLANNLVNQAMAEPTKTTEKAVITSPLDTLVNLPGGFITPAGEVIRIAEVKELNGRDEELISKSSNSGRTFSTILSCGVVSIGGVKATDALLDELLSGDRDALMLGIYKATFGNTALIQSFCSTCETPQTVEVNIDTDIEMKKLLDPIADRSFTVRGREQDYLVSLPTGATQRELSTNLDKTMAELTSILLQGTVIEIGGRPVVSKQQVLSFGLQDRKAISNEIADRNPGPQFNDTTVDCPDCGGKVAVPINLGTLFRF